MSEMFHNEILGHDISDVEAAKRAEEMLQSHDADAADETACNHKVVLPFEEEYACAYCHASVSLSNNMEVWVTLDNGLMKIDVGMKLGDLFG